MREMTLFRSRSHIRLFDYLSQTRICARDEQVHLAQLTYPYPIVDDDDDVREMNLFISRTYAKVIHECELVSKPSELISHL